MADAPDIILNVDDYAPARYARSRLLRQAGFHVFEAETGEAALAIVRDEQPHLVVLDVNLPDISGFDVCHRIKGNPETASVLVLQLSASSVSVASKLRSFAAGADAYLTEPLEPEEFLANVGALLRMRRAELALRETNATLRTLVEAAPLAIVATDREGRVTTWNPAAEQLFGWPGAEVIGQAIPGVPPQRADKDVSSTREPSGAPVAFETEQVRRDGSVIDVRVHPAHIPSADGSPGKLTLIEDISDRRQLEIERVRLLKEAQRANMAKDEFLALLSHELRTPLNAIAGWVRLMRTGELPPSGFAHALEVLERNTQAQIKLIEDILDISRIVGGSLAVDPHPLDLAQIVSDAADTIRPAAEKKGLALDVHIETGTAPIEGDRTRLLQVVGNLLSNSVKFTSRGSVTLTLRSAGSGWLVSVQDTGIGISPSFLPHVFDRFRQADTTMSRVHGGLGLGLSIVRHLVEAHKGSVHVESGGEGEGSTFTVWLPALKRRHGRDTNDRRESDGQGTPSTRTA